MAVARYRRGRKIQGIDSASLDPYFPIGHAFPYPE